MVLTIDPTAGNADEIGVELQMSWDGGDTWETVVDDTYASSTIGSDIPEEFYMGFSGSTGGSTNVHAIGEVDVQVPADLETTVTSQPGGSVDRLDYVEYEYEVLDVVDDREQQAAGLFEMYLGMEPDLWIETDEVEEEVPVEPDEDDEDAEPEFETETVEKETLYLEATPQMTMNQQWMMGKQQIGQDIIEKVGVDRVIVQEVIDGMGGMGMGGMMGGMGGMGGGDIEEALEDADVDADEIVDELEGADE